MVAAGWRPGDINLVLIKICFKNVLEKIKNKYKVWRRNKESFNWKFQKHSADLIRSFEYAPHSF